MKTHAFGSTTAVQPVENTHPSPSETTVTRHALARFRMHHHNASTTHLRRAFANAHEVPAMDIPPLLRRRRPRIYDRYFITNDRRGVFVVVRCAPTARRAWVIVTYLRLDPVQQAEAAGFIASTTTAAAANNTDLYVLHRSAA